MDKSTRIKLKKQHILRDDTENISMLLQGIKLQPQTSHVIFQFPQIYRDQE